jgi:Domain of unknown function (DUF4440)
MAIMNAQDILALEERRYAAMLAADVATLERLFDDELTYTHSSGAVDSKATYVAAVRDKVFEYKTIARENERAVVRGSCALVFCRLRIELLVRGAPRKVDSKSLAVWVQDGEQSRLLAVQSSAVPA